MAGDEIRREAEARIHEWDRALAPGSETPLLGDALEALRRGPLAEQLQWWAGAYRLVEWAQAHPHEYEARYGHHDMDAYSLVLGSWIYCDVWTPPAPSPEALRSWRDAEGLTQDQAGTIAGVARLAWSRWERGERAVPQWLGDVLQRRYGSAP